MAGIRELDFCILFLLQRRGGRKKAFRPFPSPRGTQAAATALDMAIALNSRQLGF